ncbi:MAG: PAS domain S-box protein, partial [Hymenobacter sp.]
MSSQPAPADPADELTPLLLAEIRALASLSEQNPNPIVRLDSTGRQLYANPAALALRQGLSRAEQVWVRQQLRAAVLTHDHATEIRVGQRYFLLQKAAIVPPEGSITLYLAETTARVNAEQQLAEQQSFISEILDTIPSSIFVRDTGGDLIFQNRVAAELSSQAPHLQKATASPSATDQAAEVDSYRATHAQVMATGEQLGYEQHITLDSGETRYLYTIKRPLLRPDGTRQVLGVSTDITDKKLADQALAEREKQYRDLMTHSQALICTHDLGGNLLTANPTAAALIQQPFPLEPGCRLEDLVPAAHQAAVREYLRQFATTDNQRGVLALAGPQGARYLLYDNHLVREAGQPPYVIGYGQDITERIRAEQALRRAKTAAEAAVLARENFLANVSHEIRTPLNGVLGMAS